MTIAKNHGKDGRFTPGNSSGRKFQPGNSLSVRSGTWTRLSLSDLPGKLRNIKRSTSDFRGALERACGERHGGVSLTQACYVNSAVWAERLLRLWAKRLADGWDGFTDDAIARCTDRIAKYAAARDAAIEKLGLSDDDVDDLARFYTLPGASCEAAVEPPSGVVDGRLAPAVGDAEATT